jgi:tRNA threonylcarbamoyladenosine biosynthesis protein TsaB
MKILAFTTSDSSISVALISDKKLIAKNNIDESGRQSELTVLEIEKILTQNKIWYNDLDLISTTNGPGSFTGTRIALTCARTLKISTNIPLVLLNSCEVIAYKYRKISDNIFVLIDAKADEFFYSQNQSQPQLAKLEDLSKIFPKKSFFLCGSGKKIAAEILQKENLEFVTNEEKDEIEADLVGFLALKKFQKQKISSQNLNPIYLREPKISARKK